ncbi:MAG: hypothetical protein PHT51_00085 [Patescibacteria group bacterium]|nr:hypothetical protein [Patescibacteria group bacterium]MDD4610633.1 hypothetical protein [Patescibacteria group bacterium]
MRGGLVCNQDSNIRFKPADKRNRRREEKMRDSWLGKVPVVRSNKAKVVKPESHPKKNASALLMVSIKFPSTTSCPYCEGDKKDVSPGIVKCSRCEKEYMAVIM